MLRLHEYDNVDIRPCYIDSGGSDSLQWSGGSHSRNNTNDILVDLLFSVKFIKVGWRLFAFS